MALICKPEFSVAQVFKYLLYLDRQDGVVNKSFMNWLSDNKLLCKLPQRCIKVKGCVEMLEEKGRRVKTLTANQIKMFKFPVQSESRTGYLVFFRFDPNSERNKLGYRFDTQVIVHLVEDVQEDIKSEHGFLYMTKDGYTKANRRGTPLVLGALAFRLNVRWMEKSKADIRKALLRFFRTHYKELEERV